MIPDCRQSDRSDRAGSRQGFAALPSNAIDLELSPTTEESDIYPCRQQEGGRIRAKRVREQHVDLDVVDLQLDQIAQAGMPGSEIVDDKTNIVSEIGTP